jgi:hypothetical protein
MPVEMIGRRIPVVDQNVDPYSLVTQPGDYYGPTNYIPGVLSVWYLLPIARDPGVPSEARALHHVQIPPHTCREEPDGSLTLRESIGAGLPAYYWHGFLTEGRWELEKSKP